jgi:putative ABC transport system permease protein
MFVTLIGASAVIFGLVMYLMIAVMIDRSSFGISLLKIFGFRRGEIKKLYLDGNRLMIIAGAVIAVPVAKWFMDMIFPSFIGNVACAIHLEFPWYLYLIIFAGILITYELINFFMMGKLGRISQTEVLKNRE